MNHWPSLAVEPSDGEVTGAISVIGPGKRLDDESLHELAEHVIRSVNSIEINATSVRDEFSSYAIGERSSDDAFTGGGRRVAGGRTSTPRTSGAETGVEERTDSPVDNSSGIERFEVDSEPIESGECGGVRVTVCERLQ